MRSTWHHRHPELADQIRGDLSSRYPNLHLFIDPDGTAIVRGTFPVRSREGEKLDRYQVCIQLPPDYPKGLPVVREIGGRIPWKAELHVDSEGKACVFLPDERGQCFPEGASFLQFLEGPLHNFFLGQSLVALGEQWPFGEWSHGREGVREYYESLLETHDVPTILRFLRILTRPAVKGHWSCPCGSGKKIRQCCRTRLESLRNTISPVEARRALQLLASSISPDAALSSR